MAAHCGADEFAAGSTRERRGSGDDEGAGRCDVAGLPPGQRARRDCCRVGVANLLGRDLDHGETGCDDEQDSRDRDGELGGDTATIAVAPISP